MAMIYSLWCHSLLWHPVLCSGGKKEQKRGYWHKTRRNICKSWNPGQWTRERSGSMYHRLFLSLLFHDLISMTLMKGSGLLDELDGLIGLLREGKEDESAACLQTKCIWGDDQSWNRCHLCQNRAQTLYRGQIIRLYDVVIKSVITCRQSGRCALMKGRNLTSHLPGNTPSDHASLGSAHTKVSVSVSLSITPPSLQKAAWSFLLPLQPLIFQFPNSTKYENEITSVF